VVRVSKVVVIETKNEEELIARVKIQPVAGNMRMNDEFRELKNVSIDLFLLITTN
jgi:hypothetical protein